MKPTIAITIGDFNGIGPEVVLKSITSKIIQKEIQPILVGSLDIFQHYASALKLKIDLVKIDSIATKVSSGAVPVLSVHNATIKNLQLGKTSPDAGVCA